MAKRMYRGNKYAQHVEAELDLHGHSALEARSALESFLCEARLRKLSLVRIVVGKGTHSQHGPVLPNLVKAYLNAQSVPYRYAKLFEGGEGALEVVLPTR